MSQGNADWDLDALGPQVGPRKGELLDLESRVDWSERFVSQHERDIKQTRYEAATISAHLERRLKGLERLDVFFAEVLAALIAILFAGLAAAYVHDDIYWSGGSALLVFAIIFFTTNFLFRKVTDSCRK
jgi:hypothetical protein